MRMLRRNLFVVLAVHLQGSLAQLVSCANIEQLTLVADMALTYYNRRHTPRNIVKLHDGRRIASALPHLERSVLVQGVI